MPITQSKVDEFLKSVKNMVYDRDRVYIAGPMSGYYEYNIPAFRKAEQLLHGWGFQKVINPARNFDGDLTLPWDTYVNTGELQAAKCGMMVLLPGWQQSQGVRRELAALGSHAPALDPPAECWALEEDDDGRARLDYIGSPFVALSNVRLEPYATGGWVEFVPRGHPTFDYSVRTFKLDGVFNLDDGVTKVSGFNHIGNWDARLEDLIDEGDEVFSVEDTVTVGGTYLLRPCSRDDLQETMNTVFEECRELRDAGQSEYAHDEDNAFANFERIGRELGLSREKTLWVYAMKHKDGIAAHINGHTSQRESVRGRINDLIVYLVLLRAMVDHADA